MGTVMIFEVYASQIERLDENQLVGLLRRLIQSELYKNAIPLRFGTVPAQINIPDGGDDGRVFWTGGPNETDWLPSRFTVFQCKKGKTSPASLRAETHTKSSQKSENPQLNEALNELLSNSGSYIIVTTTPIIGTKLDRRIAAIKEGITETGADLALLSSVEIYDCNKLAAWTNMHASVGLWLNTLLREVNLGGFQTYEGWGRSQEISQIQFQQSGDRRFCAKGAEIQIWRNDDPTVSDEKSFSDISDVISCFFQDKGQAIRVIGPSGYGKTRFIYELVANKSNLVQDALDESQIIYCDYEEVNDKLVNTVRSISDSGSKAVFIVDDCPDEIHVKLSEIIHRVGSRCLLITLGVETRAYGVNKNLIIQLNAASDELINHIGEATNKEISDKNAALIRDLSQGYPKMAIVASAALENGDKELSSVDTLTSRIIWGDQKEDRLALENLQLVSLFTIVGIENDVANELDEIASFVKKPAKDIFQELSRFSERGTIFRQGDYAEVQPLPLAMRLANQWLENSPAGTLEAFFRSLSEKMKLRMVGRLRWVSWSEKVTNFARTLLDEALPDETALNSEFGSKLLDRFVHLAPDATMDHLERLLANKTLDELAEFSTGRRHTIWALEKLVFRKQTFYAAASLLLRFSAAENEDWSNNASGQFIGLFQLYLSGTEATPEEKVLVLDDGLVNGDQRVRTICVDALIRMLDSGTYSRSGGGEYIGSGEALEDWHPKLYDDIFNYYRSALSRLEIIALSTDDPNAKRALGGIGTHLRSLFSLELMLDEVQQMIARIFKIYPNWKEPLLAVNEWLFFDRTEAEAEHRTKIRTYFDQLLPVDLIELLHFYSSGWASDFHDPDISYDRETDSDHDYGVTKIEEAVKACPKEATSFFPLLEKLMEEEVPSARVALFSMAKHIMDPVKSIVYLLENTPVNTEKTLISDMIQTIIAGASQKKESNGLECLELALSCKEYRKSSIDFISSIGLNDSFFLQIIDLVESDGVDPAKVLLIGFNDKLSNIKPSLIGALIKCLLGKGESGAWAALEFLSRIAYRTDPINGELADWIIQSVSNPELFNKLRYSTMDWYHWCDLIKKLLEGGHVNDKVCAKLTDFIISVIGVSEFNVQLTFDDYAQTILRRLISKFPRIIWEKYQIANATPDGMNTYRLKSLFGADIGKPSGPGVLNDIPVNIYTPWMLTNKEKRMPFILDWIRLFVGEGDEHSWSPDFIVFIDAYIENTDNLAVVLSRMTNGSYSGSRANKLEIERGHLIRLMELSKNPHVRVWCNRAVSRMDQEITAERKAHENQEASYRA